MRIDRYYLINEPGNGWKFPDTHFQRVNLVVGDSGTGKTRFLNTISNFAKQAVATSVKYVGEWKVVFSIDYKQYEWHIEVIESDIEDEKIVKFETLKRIKDNDETIIKRENNNFVFNGTNLPKLSQKVTSISLLKEEEEIQKIYDGFRRVITRRFYGNELSENYAIYSLNNNIVSKYKKNRNLQNLMHEKIGFQNKMYVLHSVFNKEYIELIEFYKEVFPFIEEFKFYDFDKFQQNAMIPFKTKVFCFKEKNLDNWIPVNDISSGMQKIFLIAQDLFLMPDGGISIIDEYENSLGINAINYFPELILTKNLKSQFFISSHHPYIINNVPIENWLVFNRKGTTVRIKTGKELKTDFGKSKQQQFIKLINDPFYLEGIE